MTLPTDRQMLIRQCEHCGAHVQILFSPPENETAMVDLSLVSRCPGCYALLPIIDRPPRRRANPYAPGANLILNELPGPAGAFAPDLPPEAQIRAMQGLMRMIQQSLGQLLKRIEKEG
jgi:hypothetical protein